MGAPPRPPSLIVELVALALWLGASIIVAAVVAPALFAVLPNRTLAGDVVGRVLPTLFYAGIVVALLAVALEARAAGRVFTAHVTAGLLLGAVCGAALAIGRGIDRLRASIGGPIDTLVPDDARRIAFGRLHALSVGALGVGMLAALVLAISAARRLAVRPIV
jgi:Domain of unknown function (DUF4149)